MKIFISISIILLVSINVIAQEAEQHSPKKFNGNKKTINYKLPFTDAPQDIIIEEVDNKAIFEGDIVLYELDDPTLSRDAGMVRYDDGGHDYRWPEGVMPYELGDHHNRYDDIQEAIKIINDKTVLQLRPKTKNDDYYIEFRYRLNSCSSPVGRQPGGVNEITIGKGCSLGSIIHEIFHSAGMYHEQSRADRDDYVRINYDNVKNGAEGNFDKTQQSMSVCDYDFGSIMQYGPAFFSKDEESPTIRPINQLPEGVHMGQRDGLSPCDIKGILNMYKTISPKAKDLGTYWFGDLFTFMSLRERGNTYLTGQEDWDFKPQYEYQHMEGRQVNENIKEIFNRQNHVLETFDLQYFTVEDYKVEISASFPDQLKFDVRFGRAGVMNYWYEAQWSPTAKPATNGYEMKASYSLDSYRAQEETYFVVLVARYKDHSRGTEMDVPIAIRYFKGR